MGLKESGLRGSIRNVSTGIGAAISIDTLEAENIDNESATIRGEITALTNFGEQSEVFFEWGEDSAGLPNTTDIQEQGEVGIFTEDLTGLETGESYEFQAFGSVRDVSDEGAILSFETDDFEIAVTTLEATNVEQDSATIRGEITELTNFGEDAEVFFEWGEITQGLPNTTDIQLQDTVGVFTEDLTNLSEDTTHEFQAFGSVRDVSDDGVVLTFETGSAIPDSAIAHWRLDDVNNEVVDNIGGYDGTVNGVTSISGDYEGGSAAEGDGTDDNIEFPVVPITVLEDFAIELTLDNILSSSDSNARFWQMSQGTDTQWVACRTSDGKAMFEIIDGGGSTSTDRVRTESSQSINDGGKHHIVFNKTGNDDNGLEIYIDASEDYITNQAGTLENEPNLNAGRMFCREFNGLDSFFEGVIDNVLVYEDSLTASEIQGRYDAQPWS